MRNAPRGPASFQARCSSQAPKSVALYGRDHRHHLVLEQNRVYLGTRGTAVDVLDLEGVRRPSTLDEVYLLGRLVDAMPNVHFYMLPVYRIAPEIPTAMYTLGATVLPV